MILLIRCFSNNQLWNIILQEMQTFSKPLRLLIEESHCHGVATDYGSHQGPKVHCQSLPSIEFMYMNTYLYEKIITCKMEASHVSIIYPNQKNWARWGHRPQTMLGTSSNMWLKPKYHAHAQIPSSLESRDIDLITLVGNRSGRFEHRPPPRI